MLQYIVLLLLDFLHQLVVNFVRLLFGAEQVAYGLFATACLLKTAARLLLETGLTRVKTQ